MTVKLKIINGKYEITETGKHLLGATKEWHPDILAVWVYSNGGNLIAKRKRHFQWFYKKFIYKPLQEPQNNMMIPPKPDMIPSVK